jgi:hypothetical protein
VPSFDGGDDFVWIFGPDEGLGIFVGFGNEAVDCSLRFDDGFEDAALYSPPPQFGEVSLDCIKPRRRCRREVEGEAPGT